MNRDLIEVLSALVLIAVCAGIAIASAGRAASEPRPRRRDRRKTRLAAPPLEPAETVAVPPAGVSPPPLKADGPVGAASEHIDRRPRIFTGEPGRAEPEPSAHRRAMRLVGWMTLLAAAGAIGVLALVSAMIEMFRG
jgi:hypothetical protein